MSEGAIHLKVTARGDKRYWLKVAVPPSTKLTSLDEFLRSIWLECCGHLSAFRTPGRQGTEIDPNLTAGTVFGRVTSLEYVYDFGSSTELLIKRIKAAPTKARGITLVGRNEQPPESCDECGAPATSICCECSLDGGGLWCDEHSAEHECGEESLLPVVNSPRMGVCAYGG